MLENIVLGFSVAVSATNLSFCFIGVLLGMFIGVLPGIGPLAATSLLLPVTFYLEPSTALIMLAGVYYGAEYGGSTASILLNLPGTPANAVACLDGYPMSKQGRAGVALMMTTIGSFVGGSIGIVVLMALTPAVVAFAKAIGPTDYFAVMLFGLLAAATIGQGSPARGIAMVVIGVLLGSIGADMNSGTIRYGLGIPELFDGLHLVVLAMGLFGVSEVIASITTADRQAFQSSVSLRSMIPTRDDMRRSVFPILRGTAVGSFFGPLPGTGPSIAAFMSYALEKRVARDPSRFGQGAIEGVSAPESANNAAAQTAFVPTLAMGIPGSPTMAIMLGAMMIHGIQAGPLMMTEHPDVFWGVVASFWIGNLMLLVLNIPLIGIWVRILQIPYRLLYPSILCLICIGVYSTNSSAFDVWMVLFFGLVGYLFKILDLEPAPLLLGFILGPLMEEHLRRALLLSRGDFLVFFEQPISGTLIVVTVGLVLWAVTIQIRRFMDPVRPGSEEAVLGETPER